MSAIMRRSLQVFALVPFDPSLPFIADPGGFQCLGRLLPRDFSLLLSLSNTNDFLNSLPPSPKSKRHNIFNKINIL